MATPQVPARTEEGTVTPTTLEVSIPTHVLPVRPGGCAIARRATLGPRRPVPNPVVGTDRPASTRAGTGWLQ